MYYFSLTFVTFLTTLLIICYCIVLLIFVYLLFLSFFIKLFIFQHFSFLRGGTTLWCLFRRAVFHNEFDLDGPILLRVRFPSSRVRHPYGDLCGDNHRTKLLPTLLRRYEKKRKKKLKMNFAMFVKIFKMEYNC